jgi:ubiquinone/menaquinone biosynthesis C-methylase UbiE
MPFSVLSRARAWVWSHAYNRGPARFYRPAYAHIADAVAPDQGAMLDVGCGPGWLCILAARGRPGLDVVGIDTSPDMIELALQNRADQSQCTFRQMDGAEVDYPDQTFQVITAVQTAHHWKDIPGILSEMHRVLSPGASAYIYDADGEAEIPDNWLERSGASPTDANLRKRWETYSLSEEGWSQLIAVAAKSPFGGSTQDKHGFYRRLVLTRGA